MLLKSTIFRIEPTLSESGMSQQCDTVPYWMQQLSRYNTTGEWDIPYHLTLKSVRSQNRRA